MTRCAKRWFKDEIAAKLALCSIQRRDYTDKPKTEKRAYLCPSCRGWHLTSRGGGGQSLPSSGVRRVLDRKQR